MDAIPPQEVGDAAIAVAGSGIGRQDRRQLRRGCRERPRSGPQRRRVFAALPINIIVHFREIDFVHLRKQAGTALLEFVNGGGVALADCGLALLNAYLAAAAALIAAPMPSVMLVPAVSSFDLPS